MPEHDEAFVESNALRPPELSGDGAWAVFLDVDGTLVEFAATPDDVRVTPGLVGTLRRLRGRLGGALALVSGRPLDEIDALFAPVALPAAGVHGAERRSASGAIRRITVDPASLDPVRAAFASFAADHPGTIVEDKQFAVALHYRRRPDVIDEARRLSGTLAETLGVDFDLLEGKMVVEVRVRAAHKGAAVEAFLQDPEFAGRRPVYVGDDVTDEDAFRTVNVLGGMSVVVGHVERTAARYALPDVSAVHRWLRTIETQLERD